MLERLVGCDEGQEAGAEPSRKDDGPCAVRRKGWREGGGHNWTASMQAAGSACSVSSSAVVIGSGPSVCGVCGRLRCAGRGEKRESRVD